MMVEAAAVNPFGGKRYNTSLSRACVLRPAPSFNLNARDVDVAGGRNGTALLNARCTTRPQTCALPDGRACRFTIFWGSIHQRRIWSFYAACRFTNCWGSITYVWEIMYFACVSVHDFWGSSQMYERSRCRFVHLERTTACITHVSFFEYLLATNFSK